MGYRSDVCIRIKNEHVTPEFKTLCKSESFEITEGEVLTQFRIDQTKWYIEYYKNYNDIMAFLRNLPSDEDWAFVRIGEEDGDVELEGSPYDLGIYVDTIFNLETLDTFLQ